MGDLRGKRLGTILVTLGVIDGDQEAAALEKSREWNVRFGEAGVRMGFFDEDMVVRGLAMQMGAPFVMLSRLTIRDDVRVTVDAQTAIRHRIVPVQILDLDKNKRTTLVVAMPAQKDEMEIAEIAFATGCRIHPVIAAEREIDEMIEKLYGGTGATTAPGGMRDSFGGAADDAFEIERDPLAQIDFTSKKTKK